MNRTFSNALQDALFSLETIFLYYFSMSKNNTTFVKRASQLGTLLIVKTCQMSIKQSKKGGGKPP
jgi:hypothetical protein